MAAAQVPNTPIRRLLESVKVTSLINPQRDLLILSPDEEIGAAFEKIVHRRLISAPVYDKHLKQYVGFLDVKDLVSLVVFKEEERKKAEQQPHLSPSASGSSSLEPPKADFRQVFDVAAKMYARPEQGVTITYLARRHGFHAVKDSDTLLHVVELLSRHDVHRVPVLEAATGRLLDIVSQSTVAKWLDQHADAPEVAAALGRTVESAPQLGTANPQCALDTDIALDVFKTMSAHNRSGMAIVDETGRFLGNTSGSDLKLLLHGYQHAHALLHGNIFDFQAAVRQADVVDHYPTIAVSRHDTVRHLVQKICATHVHRIFVADGDHGYKPERVVSITDVFRYLLADGTPATAEAPQIRVVSD